MNGIDTNVLVRYLTQDDLPQARAVDELIADTVEEGGRLHVDDIVLCELVWVLRGAYRLEQATITAALDRILSTGLFAFEDREVLRHALDDYRGGDGDFADYLIGRRNARAGCASTITFDRALDSSAGFTRL